MRLVILISLMALFCCCADTADISSPIITFNSKLFFENQVSKFQKNHYSLEKELQFNSQQKTVYNKNIDWKTELGPFTELNLIKFSHDKRFNKDSMSIDAEHYQISYLSSDPKTRINKIELIFKYGNPDPEYFYCLIREKNNIYESEKKLTYYSDSLYTIEGSRKVRLLDEVRFKIRGRIRTD